MFQNPLRRSSQDGVKVNDSVTLRDRGHRQDFTFFRLKAAKNFTALKKRGNESVLGTSLNALRFRHGLKEEFVKHLVKYCLQIFLQRD